MPDGFAFFVGPSLFDVVFLSHMSTRYSLICSTMVTVELGLLSLERVNSSFFVFSVLDYFDNWSSGNKRINTAP